MSNLNIEMKKNKKKTIIVCSSIGIVVLILSLVLFITLYLIPYNKVKVEYKLALKQLDSEIAALEDRNKELDINIELLNQVINAENIPIDELLLSDAQDILEEARNYPKDSAPKVPEITLSIEKVKLATSEILSLTESVHNMGDYTNILTKVKNTKTEYNSMIENFTTAETEQLWIGVDKDMLVLRFVIKFSNKNDYTLRNVSIEWTAFDVNGVIVGSFSTSQPDIPANGCIYYVGGTGSAHLSGIPATVKVEITNKGLLTNRDDPKIDVKNVQLKNNGYGFYTVSADCQTNTEINSAQLDGQFILKNANGEIIDADFWNADDLPDTIKENGRFKASNTAYDLPDIPKNAEVYMYYKWN